MKYVLAHYNVVVAAWRDSDEPRRTLYFVKVDEHSTIRNTLLSQAKIFDTAKEAEECKRLEALLSEAHIVPVTDKELFTARLKGI